MTDKQENKLSMFYAVIKIVEKFTAVWTSNVPFSTGFSIFKSKVASIEANRNTQVASKEGTTKDKEAKKSALVKKAFFICSRLKSLAINTGNTELGGAVNFSKTDFSKLRDTDLVGLVTNILARANANAAALVPYSVPAALITDLSTALTAYSGVISAPRSATVASKAATENLLTLFEDAMNALTERMDNDILVFESTNQDFYDQYFASRKIIHTSTTRLSVKGTITESDETTPISGVKITISNVSPEIPSKTDTPPVSISKKTTSKGNFQLKNIPEGTYMVTLSKVGYKTVTVKTTVTDDKTTLLEVSLAAE
ncbi:MAG: carboxypeptidase-like regulatory domain-containing protein [Cytophagales bacterium]|nr:carboxypeptidase-like regulatory domain-containing protein [Cytophagales bacterium]